MKVSGLRAQRDAQARHLLQSPRDERDARVGAEAQAVGQAGADRERVLHRPADLDAEDVRGGVGAEVRRRQLLRPASARRPHRPRRWSWRSAGPHRPRAAKVGPESTATRRSAPSTSRATWCGSEPGVGLEALGRPGDVHRGVRAGRAAVSSARSAWLGTTTQHVVRAGERRAQLRDDLQGVGEVGAGQVARVAALERPSAPAAARRGPTGAPGVRRARTAPRARCPRSRHRARRSRSVRRAAQPVPARPGEGALTSWWSSASAATGWRRTARRSSPAAAGTAGSRPG